MYTVGGATLVGGFRTVALRPPTTKQMRDENRRRLGGLRISLATDQSNTVVAHSPPLELSTSSKRRLRRLAGTFLGKTACDHCLVTNGLGLKAAFAGRNHESKPCEVRGILDVVPSINSLNSSASYEPRRRVCRIGVIY